MKKIKLNEISGIETKYLRDSITKKNPEIVLKTRLKMLEEKSKKNSVYDPILKDLIIFSEKLDKKNKITEEKLLEAYKEVILKNKEIEKEIHFLYWHKYFKETTLEMAGGISGSEAKKIMKVYFFDSWWNHNLKIIFYKNTLDQTKLSLIIHNKRIEEISNYKADVCLEFKRNQKKPKILHTKVDLLIFGKDEKIITEKELQKKVRWFIEKFRGDQPALAIIENSKKTLSEVLEPIDYWDAHNCDPFLWKIFSFRQNFTEETESTYGRELIIRATLNPSLDADEVEYLYHGYFLEKTYQDYVIAGAERTYINTDYPENLDDFQELFRPLDIILVRTYPQSDSILIYMDHYGIFLGKDRFIRLSEKHGPSNLGNISCNRKLEIVSFSSFTGRKSYKKISSVRQLNPIVPVDRWEKTVENIMVHFNSKYSKFWSKLSKKKWKQTQGFKPDCLCRSWVWEIFLGANIDNSFNTFEKEEEAKESEEFCYFEAKNVEQLVKKNYQKVERMKESLKKEKNFEDWKLNEIHYEDFEDWKFNHFSEDKKSGKREKVIKKSEIVKQLEEIVEKDTQLEETTEAKFPKVSEKLKEKFVQINSFEELGVFWKEIEKIYQEEEISYELINQIELTKF